MNNYSKVCVKNNSVVNPVGESEDPIQTYSFRLQNNKPMRMFIRVRNEGINNREQLLRAINLIQKIQHVLIRKKRDVFEDCKEMMVEEEEFQSHGPSLLEEIMKSEIPVRNGSFMNGGVAFSVIRSNTELNKSRDQSTHFQRNSISSKSMNGLLALTVFVQAQARREERYVMDILKQQSRIDSEQLLRKVIDKMAFGSCLTLQTSLLRLKSICMNRANPQTQQKDDIAKLIEKKPQLQIHSGKQMAEPESTDNHQQRLEIVESLETGDGKATSKNWLKRQQVKRLECFTTILDNIDKLKTFEIVSLSFSAIRTKA